MKGLSEYHYRLVAESSKGKTKGADKSFTTQDWRPYFGLSFADFGEGSSRGVEAAALR